MKKRIVVVGANGQLGRCIQELVEEHLNFEFYFFSSKELDITLKKEVLEVFAQNDFDYCINCAAFTAVDLAETQKENTYKVNVEGVKNLSMSCKKNDIKLIHISTDFVFDGKNNKAYLETDLPNPISVYGKTKLEGEKAIIKHTEEYFIIRTSWLYSEFGKNFYKTMLSLAKKHNAIKVVSDQIGCPTYTPDLAKAIVTIINSDSKHYGIYHFSNNGITSWYDFACAIFKKHKLDVKIIPISSSQFKSKAKRPKYSLLNNNKIKNTFDIKIPHWQESLDNIGV